MSRLASNPPALYGPNGAGHRVLRVLAEGPASRDDIYLATMSLTRKGRSRIWYVLDQLKLDGLIRRTSTACFEITREGRAALADLDAGIQVHGSVPSHSGGAQERAVQTSVRVFVSRERAA